MDYGIYLATVVGVTTSDNRFQVKILPQMKEIDDNSCPIWPFFFKDEMLILNKGDLVWVICNNEFSFGYILGEANYSTYQDESFSKRSIPEDLKNSLNKVYVDLKSSKFNFLDLKVIFWNSECIHFIERKTGGVVYAFKVGTLYIFRPNEFRVNLGDNSIKIGLNDVSIKGNSIRLQSEDVELGKNPGKNVLTTMGVEGKLAEASPYVKA